VAANKNLLTPHGVARLLGRGVRASFAPEHQEAEVERLVEYLQDLAVSRANEAELPGGTSAAAARASSDAEWLETIACGLQESLGGCEFCREPANRPNDPTWQCPYCGAYRQTVLRKRSEN
jgi:hypothetical protein